MNTQQRELVERLRDRYRSEDAAPAPHKEAPAHGAAYRSLTEVLSQDTLALVVEPRRSATGDAERAFDIEQIARDCEAEGAAAISVVTEGEVLDGSRDDLVRARGACGLPLLARDIIVSTAQVADLRRAGADAIFLPVAPFVDGDDLPEGQRLADIVRAAMALGMESVLSLGSEEELERALDADPDVLNIDNRDDDGRIDVERTLELLASVPVGKAVISESVASGEEVARLHRAGVDGLLLDEGHLETGLATALATFRALTLD